jgi:rRNA maturation RNase YbeY
MSKGRPASARHVTRADTRHSHIEIELNASAGKKYARTLLARAREAAAFVPRCPTHISLALVGDTTMARLHVDFMNIAGTTDVLTFELHHDDRGRCLAGEIVVCVPEAARQARRHGTRVEHELLLYVVHGLLHLTGHDDHDEVAYQRMHREEDRILKRMGIGPVFRPALPKKHTKPKSLNRNA